MKRGDPNELTNTEQIVLDQLADSAFVINTRGIILYANKNVALLGYQPGELMGKNISVIMPSNHSVKHDNYLKVF